MEDGFHIWTLITKKLSGEASPSEEKELYQLLMVQPSWQYAYEMLSKWWAVRENKEKQTDRETLSSWNHLKEQIGANEPDTADKVIPETREKEFILAQKPKKRAWRTIAWMTSITVIVILIGFYLIEMNPSGHLMQLAHGGKNTLSEVSTRYGSKSKITLPDGTTVWLNSGSNLFYNNKNFGDADREVTLSGEAFFNVMHDPEHPFIIHAGKINVEVLGTSFDVKNYPDDKTVEATLIKGSIEVTFANEPDRKVLLKPDEKLTVFNNGKTEMQHVRTSGPEIKNEYKISALTILPEDSTVVETSWVQNKLAFSSETFTQLAIQMERWYNIKINFSDSKVQHYCFTGIFEDETLDQALKALQITAPFHYKVEKNEVYISNP